MKKDKSVEKGLPGRHRLPEDQKNIRKKYPISIHASEMEEFQTYAKNKKFPSLAEFLRAAARYYMERNP